MYEDIENYPDNYDKHRTDWQTAGKEIREIFVLGSNVCEMSVK